MLKWILLTIILEVTISKRCKSKPEHVFIQTYEIIDESNNLPQLSESEITPAPISKGIQDYISLYPDIVIYAILSSID